MKDWERKPGFDLSGQKALVLGFANPAGSAIALGLAEAGADVATAAASTDGEEVMEAKRASRQVTALGRATFSQAWDITLPTNVQVSLKQLIKEFGAPTVLVVNADLAVIKPFEKVTDAEFGRMQQMNTAGPFYAARSFARELPEGVAGRIVYITSILAERGVVGLGAHAAAKSGVAGLVAGLSQEVAARGVTVNAIATGWMDWTEGRGSDDPGENRLLRYIPLRRFGTADDLVPLAVLLASPAGGFISGQVFRVDGGVSGHL